MSANPPTQIYTHHLLDPNSNDTISQALCLLRPHLPTSLPLYRRLQVGRFFPATILLTNLSSLENAPSNPEDQPWLIAFLDRTPRPETEVWLFGSWEVSPSFNPEDQVQHQAIARILTSLIRTINSFPLPTSLHEDALSTTTDEPDSAGLSRTNYTSHLSNPSLTLWGAVHSRTAHILQSMGVLFDLSGKGEGMVPNGTFIFNLSDGSFPTTINDALPDGLNWGQLQYSHFAVVRSRTQIPRQDRTLAVLPHLAIFSGKEPIAWSFVGLDGSLTTLHVEASHRRLGLAKTMTRKLFREKMEHLWEDEMGVTRWAHGYVIEGNAASEGVCGSLGGVKAWDAYWVRVDLGRVGRVEDGA